MSHTKQYRHFLSPTKGRSMLCAVPYKCTNPCSCFFFLFCFALFFCVCVVCVFHPNTRKQNVKDIGSNAINRGTEIFGKESKISVKNLSAM